MFSIVLCAIVTLKKLKNSKLDFDGLSIFCLLVLFYRLVLTRFDVGKLQLSKLSPYRGLLANTVTIWDRSSCRVFFGYFGRF